MSFPLNSIRSYSLRQVGLHLHPSVCCSAHGFASTQEACRRPSWPRPQVGSPGRPALPHHLLLWSQASSQWPSDCSVQRTAPEYTARSRRRSWYLQYSDPHSLSNLLLPNNCCHWALGCLIYPRTGQLANHFKVLMIGLLQMCIYLPGQRLKQG